MTTPLPRSAIIVGGGVGGLATAALLARAGVAVSVYEQHDGLGGRAGVFEAQGFRFDRGPSWLLMPDVFEHYFSLFGERFQDILDLQRLDPAYRVFFESGVGPFDIHGDVGRDGQTFAALEPGADVALRRYLAEAEKTYKAATSSFLYTNFDNYPAFVRPDVLRLLPALGLAMAQTIDRYVSRYVSHPALKQLLEYHMVFLGTSPYTASSLFRFMGYLDYKQGVYYPRGGIYRLTQALEQLAQRYGAHIHTNAPVARIIVERNHALGVHLADGTRVDADVVISNADLRYTETTLLPAAARTYSDRYFAKQTSSPSALLMYLGVRGALPQLSHHTLLFTADWRRNFSQMLTQHTWPQPASMYVCKPSETDATVAPKGYENVFVLVPGPAGNAAATSDEELLALADYYIDQLATQTGITDLRSRLVYKQLCGPRDFVERYYATDGSMLGPANSLRQSALWRAATKSKTVDNLYYVGASVQPGIGLPLCLISAELVYKRLVGDRSISQIASLPARQDGSR